MRTLLLLAILAPTLVYATEDTRGRSIAAQEVKIKEKASKLDVNGDGWLDEYETAKGQQTLGVLFGAVKNRLDANGDGKISVDEYTSGQVDALRKADTNHDGFVDQKEERVHKRRLIGELLTGG